MHFYISLQISKNSKLYNILITIQKLFVYTTIYNFYRTLHTYTNTMQVYNTFYKTNLSTLHNFTNLYTIYKIIQNYTKTIYNFTKLYTTIPHFTKLEIDKIIQHYHKTPQHLTKVLQNILFTKTIHNCRKFYKMYVPLQNFTQL